MSYINNLGKILAVGEKKNEQIVIFEIKKHRGTVVKIGVYPPSDDADTKIKKDFYDNFCYMPTQVTPNKNTIKRFLSEGRQKM